MSTLPGIFSDSDGVFRRKPEKPLPLGMGSRHARIRYGKEEGFWGEIASKQSCHDCGVFQGEYHIPGCDHERCPKCRMMDGMQSQIISCGCFSDWTDGVFVPSVRQEDDEWTS